MKKLMLSILLLIFLMSCKTQQIALGLSEQKFTREHPYATRMELSVYRTVYLDNQTTEFYYFKDSKLYKMDHGFTPYGSTKPQPTR